MNWKKILGLPEDVEDYFYEIHMMEYQEEHPIKYWVMVAAIIASLVLPAVLYLIYTDFIRPAPNSMWLLVGFLGAGLIGLGLCNILSILYKQYLGHVITIVSLVAGVILIHVSNGILYDQKRLHSFDENAMIRYLLFFTWIIAAGGQYIFFRWSVMEWADRNKVKKIEQKMKGIREYWWFERIHKEYNMGWIYTLNKVFTILYIITFLMGILLSGNAFQFRFICIMLSALCLMCALFNTKVFDIVFGKKKRFGKKITMHHKNKYLKGSEDKIGDALFTIMMAIVIFGVAIVGI